MKTAYSYMMLLVPLCRVIVEANRGGLTIGRFDRAVMGQ